jgi:hypothetical protein
MYLKIENELGLQNYNNNYYYHNHLDHTIFAVKSISLRIQIKAYHNTKSVGIQSVQHESRYYY